MIIIITPLSIKDVFTYCFRCGVYNDKRLEVHIICGKFTKFIMEKMFFINWVKFHDEDLMLTEVGGLDYLKSYVIRYNPIIKTKLSWYLQQILKYKLILDLKMDVVIIDGDTFPVDVNDVLNLKTVRFLNKYTSVHYPYEQTISKLFGRKMSSDEKNFVCEVFPVEYGKLLALINEIQVHTKINWYLAILLHSCHLIGFSEYQTYGRYEQEFEKIFYRDFPTIRTYGFIRTPLQSIVVPGNVRFVTIESYHRVKGLHGFIYAPLQFLAKLMYKLNIK